MRTITKEFTKEQLIEFATAILDVEKAMAANDLSGREARASAAIAEIALASLEAKPIGAFHIADQQVSGTTDYIKDGEWPIDDGVIEVYAAPPAPVSVPDEIESTSGSDFDDYYCDGWNACRATMLQGAENAESTTTIQTAPALDSSPKIAEPPSGNSPVIPDGWVACSERMPEVGVKVLCFPVNDEPIHATYNGQVWLQDISWSTSDEPIDNVISCNVFHWMPLPAAPQQEANND